MKRKGWGRLIGALVGILLVGMIAASFFFYDLAIKRGPKEYLQGNTDLEVSDKAMDVFLNGDWKQWVAVQPFEQLHMQSRDGLELSGYFLPAAVPTDKLVILTHGYLGNAKQMGLFGQFYHDTLQFNIFMPDARGHGKSGGDYYGFGWPDRLDLIDWTNLLVQKLGTDTEVVYHGLSMGAATVLMTSGEDDLPEQLEAIIADSPYASVYDLFAYQMKRMFHLPAFPVLDSTSVVTKMRAGYSLREANALREVAKTDVPILYIHGKGDTFVPTEMSENLYRHTRSESEIFLVDLANHGESYVLEKGVYQLKVRNFLSSHLNEDLPKLANQE
ncbi:alpha/beta hydrolase [Sporosarcina sp. FSL W7-1349]|uniref:alpha/beta hydrolase n=1 Tax=Sporosarcina sp. FSL W7-1349 TaxID=2921561 RepID=UPI0030F7A968